MSVLGRLKHKFWSWLLGYKSLIAGRRTVSTRVFDAVFFPRDVLVVFRGHHRAFGRYPRVLRPKLFNEWIQRRKLFERDPHYAILADKIAVRDYVSERVGDQYLTKIYWVGTNLEEARSVQLPAQFVLKANHSVRTNLLVLDAAKFSWEVASETSREWLLRDLSFALGEWHYRWIQPKLFIEEFLEPKPGSSSLTDYKFFVFRGKVRAIRVIEDRFGNARRCNLDRDFAPFRIGGESTESPPNDLLRPKRLDEMITVAERLADPDMAFVRVDLYEVGDRVMFGELTLTPAAGLLKFDPPGLDELLGRWWSESDG